MEGRTNGLSYPEQDRRRRRKLLNTSVKIAGLRAEIWTSYLANTKQAY